MKIISKITYLGKKIIPFNQNSFINCEGMGFIVHSELYTYNDNTNQVRYQLFEISPEFIEKSINSESAYNKSIQKKLIGSKALIINPIEGQNYEHIIEEYVQNNSNGKIIEISENSGILELNQCLHDLGEILLKQE